jgi:hypothetical protein
MNITVTQLNNLLAAAKGEGYEEGLRSGQINAQFADANMQNAQGQSYEPPTESLKSETPEVESDVVSTDEYFELYSDGFDDGYSEAIADVKESLNF